MVSTFSGLNNKKVVTKNCQAVSELQIKAQQPRAQISTPPVVKSCMHTWENAVSILNPPGRENGYQVHSHSYFSVTLSTLPLCNLWHVPDNFFVVNIVKSLGKVTSLVFFVLNFFRF